MANFAERVPDNQPGPYFVDSSCIDCDTCRCISPELFRRNDEEGYSYVQRQPQCSTEEQQMEEAMDCCPVDAIGRCPE